jgi:hypothetical protein
MSEENNWVKMTRVRFLNYGRPVGVLGLVGVLVAALGAVALSLSAAAAPLGSAAGSLPSASGPLRSAQRRDAFVLSRDHPAIAYSAGPVDNAVTRLGARLRDGSTRLRFDPAHGYLTSILEALDIPVESQTLVFSPTSNQAPLINMHNPRALFFGDTVSVGWVRGSGSLEVAVQDARQGAVFYVLPQTPSESPAFERKNDCLACHLSWDTLGVPGLMTTSMYPLPDDPNAYANGFPTIQGSPLTQRWGGWWVTGNHGGVAHMGNVPVLPVDKGRAIQNPNRVLTSVAGLFDLTGYPTAQSDVVALLVLAHQTHMTNLMTRAGWEARVAAETPSADGQARVIEATGALADYMLFADEAPLTAPVVGGAGFAERFTARGPKDSQGRSVREFDLRRRLFRYPVSYMIYAEAFDALPPAARDAVYARLWAVLSGRDRGRAYAHLSASDRQAIVQILRDTKPGLPEFFQPLAIDPPQPVRLARPVRPARRPS